MTTSRHDHLPDWPSAPAVWPSRVVTLATRTLPAGAVRERYHLEFVAELYGMDRSRQAWHALRILSRSWVLRLAVTTEGHPALKEAVLATEVVPRRPILCRLNLFHSWKWRSTEDGSRFQQCARCGKDKNDGGSGPGYWAAANPYGGGGGGF